MTMGEMIILGASAVASITLNFILFRHMERGIHARFNAIDHKLDKLIFRSTLFRKG